MQTNDSDLSKVIRDYFKQLRDPASSEAAEVPVLPTVKPEEAGRTAQSLLEILQHDRESEQYTREAITGPLQALLKEGFRETAAAYLENEPAALVLLEPSDVLLIACNEATIALWVNERSKSERAKEERPKSQSQTEKQLKNLLVKQILNLPSETVDDTLANWVCRSIDTKEIWKTVPVVASRVSTDQETPLFDLVLLRDKDGSFVTGWLRGDMNRLQPCAERIRNKPRLLRHVFLQAANWMQHHHAGVLTPLYTSLISSLLQSRGQQRAEASGYLLRLAGALVPLAPSSRTTEALLQDLQKLSLHISNEFEDSNDSHRTWVFFQSGTIEIKNGKEDDLSPEQAKHLILALMRARKGKEPLIELESAFVNLGGFRFGEVGETVTYEPTIHNDLEGGLLPGDSVIITQSGLRHDACTSNLVKADVRNNQPE